MEEYNQMQDEYRDRSKDRIQRQLKYGTINATNQFRILRCDIRFDYSHSPLILGRGESIEVECVSCLPGYL